MDAARAAPIRNLVWTSPPRARITASMTASAIADPAAFIHANTRLRPVALVPEISLHVADEALPLWSKTEDELGEAGLPPPFWAFAWAGGRRWRAICSTIRDSVAGPAT